MTSAYIYRVIIWRRAVKTVALRSENRRFGVTEFLFYQPSFPALLQVAFLLVVNEQEGCAVAGNYRAMRTLVGLHKACA